MAEAVNGEEELLDYEEDVEVQDNDAVAGTKAAAEKKGYVGIHAAGFKELMLKPELLRAITDCGFEHPSEGPQKDPSGHAHGHVWRLTGSCTLTCWLSCPSALARLSR